MPRHLLCIAAVLVAGCAGQPVVRTIPVEVRCPVAEPPVPSWELPAMPADIRDWADLYPTVKGNVEADRITAAAYRKTWEACHEDAQGPGEP